MDISDSGSKKTYRLPKNTRRAVGIFVAIIAVLVYMVSSPQQFPDTGIMTVVPGDTLESVGTKLKDEHFIRSRVGFATLVTFFGGEHSISPGDYYFEKPLSAFELARRIATGEHNLDPIKVTIPEGENVSEISAILSEKLPEFPAEEFLEIAESKEGYLFPDTYFFYPKTDAATVVREMEAMFENQTQGIFESDLIPGRTQEGIIIMASIIEREAHGTDDRAMISGILWKRLNRSMPLQVDATVAYANGISENKLTKESFQKDSPYNTYKYRGLPPGPISNPGIESLNAAISPTETDYLYYLHDRHGSIHYAKTYAEHQKNIERHLR